MSGVWESRACVNVGDSVWAGEALLGTFLIGEGALRVVRVGMLTAAGVGVNCLRFATTSENVRTGTGGVFHTGEGYTAGFWGWDREGVCEETIVGVTEVELVFMLLGG